MATLPGLAAFVTGSRVYGQPTGKSDIDLVVRLTQADYERLIALADETMAVDDIYYGRVRTYSVRFGKLNLLCCLDDDSYQLWRDCTKWLKKKAAHDGPLTRRKACDYFAEQRQKRGLA